MNILLKESTQEIQPGTKRRLRTYKVESDASMVQLHEEMMTDVDIITQIQCGDITYVMTQKIIVEPPKEIKKLLKDKKK